jgi:hypothetical protein
MRDKKTLKRDEEVSSSQGSFVVTPLLPTIGKLFSWHNPRPIGDWHVRPVKAEIS